MTGFFISKPRVIAEAVAALGDWLALPAGAAQIGANAYQTQDDANREYISLGRFGTVGDGVAVDTLAVQAAISAVNALNVGNDVLGFRSVATLYIPPGQYLINASVELPLCVKCDGCFTGGQILTYTQKKRGRLAGLSTDGVLFIRGAWFSTFSDIRASKIEINGHSTGYGTFWNSFDNIVADIEIDVSRWSVNQNQFSGRGQFTIIDGGGANSLDAHGNNVDQWDFTGTGYINAGGIGQDSLLIGTYYENGANVSGPVHVIGAQGDALSPPAVLRHNHVLCTYNQIERNRADFFAATASNLLPGGEWDYLDDIGKPVCLNIFGAVGAVTATAYEPSGIGKMYGGAFNAAFSGFNITIPANRSGQFGLVVFYRSNDDFAAIEVDRGAGGITSGGASQVSVDGANGWRMLRLSGNASVTAPTTVKLYANSAVANVRNFEIGGMFASQEKATILPSPKPVVKTQVNAIELHNTSMQWGEVVQGYVSGVTVMDPGAVGGIDVAITFPKAFSAAPVVTVSILDTNAANTYKFTKCRVLSRTTAGAVVRVLFPVDWMGNIQWHAIGPK